jgi:hypothetical protein
VCVFDALLSPFRHWLLLIRLASLMVPAAFRANWRAEWEAEVWHAWYGMRDRGETPSFVRLQLCRFCLGSFADAAWHLRNVFDREEALCAIRNRMRSPGFCLSALASLILAMGALSGFFPATRAILMPLAYANADRVATVSQSGVSLSSRAGIPVEWVGWWQAKSKLLDGAATYRWRQDTASDESGRHFEIVNARVSDNFFALLGVRAGAGRLFRRGDASACVNCVLVSDEFARRHSGELRIGGRSVRVIGILDPGFWFLSRRIAVWSLAQPSDFAPSSRTGVVIRLGPDVTPAAAEHEMERILADADLSPWVSLVDVSLVHERVHSVFGSFALGVLLAAVMAIAGLRPAWPPFERQSFARGIFFSVKTSLLLAAVLLAGLEFTRASSITMIGGTDLATEPLTTWLYLIASMGALTWSIFDQRRRCRVCLRRLGLAMHVGCPGCLLLNWAGTELVCIEGHGMLHVPEMVSSWQEAERWTALDESWLDLFAR